MPSSSPPAPSSRADDWLYLYWLAGSFLAALAVRKCPPGRKHHACGLFGVGLTAAVCGWHSLHYISLVLATIALIRLADRRHVGFLTFGFAFSYLAFFRMVHLLGLPRPYPHANAVQLFVTLRCVGLAFEVQDGEVEPDTPLVDLFCYLSSFIGMFSGPYYSYSVMRDLTRIKATASLPLWKHLQVPLLATGLYILILWTVSEFFSIETLHSDDFYENTTFQYRFLYQIPLFVVFRMRVFAAWTLGTICCIAAGLGAYPTITAPKIGKGPSNLEKFKELRSTGQLEDAQSLDWNFETVYNVDAYGVEFAPTFRAAMKCWNRSVQYWLATYVYRKCPKSYRTAMTMLVSAFWHGIHPGYYLSFLTVPFCLLAEDWMYSLFAPGLSTSDPRGPCNTWFLRLWFFFRWRGFDAMAMGFLLLSYERTIRYWSSVHWFLHVFLVIFLVIGYFGRYFQQLSDRSPKTDQSKLSIVNKQGRGLDEKDGSGDKIE